MRKVKKAVILAAGPRITLAFVFRYYFRQMADRQYTTHAAVLTGRAGLKVGGDI